MAEETVREILERRTRTPLMRLMRPGASALVRRVMRRVRLGGRAGAFTPFDIGPHAWYRADDVVLSGSSITTWTDKSPNGNDAPQGVGSAQPTQVDRYGQKAASFDGGDNMAGAFHVALTQPFSIAVVVERTVETGGDWVLDSDDVTNRMGISITNVPDVRMIAGATHVGPGFSTGAVHAFFSEVDGASSSIWLDDWTDGAVDAGDAGVHLPDGITIGAAFNLSGDLTGFIAEIAIYSKLLSTAERKSIGDYFTARYTGLTVTT